MTARVFPSGPDINAMWVIGKRIANTLNSGHAWIAENLPLSKNIHFVQCISYQSMML
jgi:hypothetical protein